MRGDFLEARYGYCGCGCGERTKLVSQTDTKRGLVAGEARTFVRGHQLKLGKDCLFYGVRKFGEDNPAYGVHRLKENSPGWKGGRYVLKGKYTSYLKIHIPEHPKADRGGYVYQHILVAEKVLCKLLPQGAEIHHVDGDGLNNNHNNLVICQSHSYHMALHERSGDGRWKQTKTN